MISNPPPWPGGARCAVAFTFDMDADSILHLSHHATADTRVAAMSALRYGPEVAVPRLVALYREFGMHQTFFLPAWCIERYPASGGADPGRRPRDRPPPLPARARQRDVGRRGTVLVREKPGRDRRRPPAGRRRDTGPAPTSSPATPSTSSSTTGSSTTRPSSVTTSPTYWRTSAARSSSCRATTASTTGRTTSSLGTSERRCRSSPTAQAHGVFREEFDAAREYGGLWVAVWHPFLSGRLARAHAIKTLIEYMHDKGPGVVRDPGGDRERMSGHSDRHRRLDASRRSAAVLRRTDSRARRGRAAQRRALTGRRIAAGLHHGGAGRRQRSIDAEGFRAGPGILPPHPRFPAMPASTDTPPSPNDANRIASALESLPHNAKLGIRTVEITRGRCTTCIEFRPELDRGPAPRGCCTAASSRP